MEAFAMTEILHPMDPPAPLLLSYTPYLPPHLSTTFFFFMSTITTYGSSQARDWIWTAIATYALGQGLNLSLCSNLRHCRRILDAIHHSRNSQHHFKCSPPGSDVASQWCSVREYAMFKTKMTPTSCGLAGQMYLFLSFFFFFLFRAVPVVHARFLDRMGATAASLRHSNTRSEAHLQPMPQLVIMPDP